MITYSEFYSEKVKIGKASAAFAENDVQKKIITAIDSEDGGVNISFTKLTEAEYKRITKLLGAKDAELGAESYAVEIEDEIKIYYTREITKLYALYAVMHKYERDGVCKGIIYNTPKLEYRGYRTYLPAKRDIDEFKRFIDFMIAFGHNAVMLEIGGAMEYKRHPEINQGWIDYCKICEEFNGKTEWVQRMSWYPKNSLHTDNGGGSFLTYEDIAEIVDYCRERNFEIIPEVPSLSHVDYLLYNHPELSELSDDLLPNNACPQNEDYYKLIFDVLDEVCEVFKPARVNICHDEAYVFGYCPRCRGKNAGELFAYHMTRLHDYLAEKNVKTMVWCDGLLPIHHGGEPAFHMRFPWDGKRLVNVHGKNHEVHSFKCLDMEEYDKMLSENPKLEGLYVPPKKTSVRLVPRDIQAIDWSWSISKNEKFLKDEGFYFIYGNFTATGMPDFNDRMKGGVKGISHSNWGMSNLEAIQRTSGLFAVGYNALAVWEGGFDSYKVKENTMQAAEEVYKFFNYETLHKPHIKFTHNTDAIIDHDMFYDGFVIIKEDYRIGDYEIKYTDGTTDIYPIYWGHNIGNGNVRWSKGELTSMEDGSVTKYIYEPIGEAKAMSEGSVSFYECAFPTNKDVESVTLKARDGYNINLKGYEIVK